MSENEKPAVYLVDGSAYIFRAYHAIQKLSTRQGVPTNAVYGTTRMLLRLIEDESPQYLAAVFDAGGRTFRHEMYGDYKAHRPPPPDDLRVQFPIVRRAVRALNLPLIEIAGVEGDDVIATLTEMARRTGHPVVIVSGDKDLMQLVGPGVTMMDPMRNVRYDPAAVREKMGVPPERIADLLALMGDSSDNVPGVSSVGEKTAARLLAEHDTLEGVLAAAPNMKPGKLRERLIAEAEAARLSLRLVTLNRTVPLPLALSDLAVRPPQPDELRAFLSEFEMTELARSLFLERPRAEPGRYRILFSREDLDREFARIEKAGVCALDLETTSLDAVRADIVGLSISCAEGDAGYVPVAHRGPDAQRQLPLEIVLSGLRRLIEERRVTIVGQNLKYDSIVLLHRHGIRLEPIGGDVMLASYVLDPGRNSHSLDSLARELLGHTPLTYAEVAGKGKNQIPFAEVPIERAAAYAGEDADFALRLWNLLLPRVRAEGLEPLLCQIELPLVPVLRDLELAGVKIDTERLRRMGQELERDMQCIVERAHALAGREFNLNSPAQLRKILFEELKLSPGRKGKSGASTDSEVLEHLAASHELPAEILNHRLLAKLKSTYVDVLPEMINPETGRLHTSFNQAVTATGRLSSSDPNLQNIPVRTDLGRRIRSAFVAEPGGKLLSADYNQVELRILAHLSQDEAFCEAFRRGEDIHARTASRIFGVDIGAVTTEQRRQAKAVNFGIVYGQGAFNLARQLGVPRARAQEIIDQHQASYPKVREWVAAMHQAAMRDKAVSTLFGRRRRLPDIDSPNPGLRANAERMAQNTPVQGTAADIIKRAMIDIHRELAARSLRSRMVLQVHDELLFEAPEDELGALESLVREKMEGAARLSVPLTVDIAWGDNWDEAH